MNKSVMIVGVGGQGTLLASRILGSALQSRGFNVKLSEVHGMSQRGGSVVTYVRFGDAGKVYSPIVEKGEADYIISFEKLEAARYADCLCKGGRVIVNSQEIDPMPVITGAAAYPHGVLDSMRAKGILVDTIDALSLAEQAGSSKATNIVLLGRLAHYFDIPTEKWMGALASCVAPKFLEMNQKAFMLGFNA